MINKQFFLALCLLIMVFSGCFSNKHPMNRDQYDDPLDMIFDPSLGDGELVFEHSVLPLEGIDHIIPLGGLAPYQHTFPTQHIYWVDYNPQKPEQQPPEVFAPAGGKILKIKEFGDQDHGILIGVTNTTTYYIYHLNLDADFKVGDTVLGGEKLGVRTLLGIGIDLGVLNKNIYNNFIYQHYPLDTYYADKPLKYFSNSDPDFLQNQLYAKVRAESSSESGPDLDGKFNFDIPGTLSGNWWLKDTDSYFADDEYGRRQLAFAYDNIYQDEISISIGKNLDDILESNILRVFYVQSDAVPPEEVEPGETVAYHLYQYRYKYIPTVPDSRVGLMMVKMLSKDQIKVEIFIDTESEVREFTDEAWEYKR